MTEHERVAYKLMKREYNDYIGGLENTLLDYDPDEGEYIAAKSDLADGEALLETVYNFTMHEAEYLKFAKHIKFAGTEFIKNEIRKLLIKDGYLKA